MFLNRLRTTEFWLRQTTRLLVNKTTSGGFAWASPNLRNHGFTDLRNYGGLRQTTRQQVRLRCALPDKRQQSMDNGRRVPVDFIAKTLLNDEKTGK